MMLLTETLFIMFPFSMWLLIYCAWHNTMFCWFPRVYSLPHHVVFVILHCQSYYIRNLIQRFLYSSALCRGYCVRHHLRYCLWLETSYNVFFIHLHYVAATVLDTTYDIVFDEEFPGALELRCTGKRGYRLNPTALINISYGHRKFKGHQKFEKTMAVVKPQVNTSIFYHLSFILKRSK